MSTRALIRTDALDQVANRLAAVRARPALWVAQEGLDSLTIYGFPKDWSIEVGENTSKLSLSVEGLSKATAIKPFAPGAGEVAWPDVTDPTGTKPANNADVTGENTAKDTAAVGGRPSSDVLQHLNTLDQGIQNVRDALDGTQAGSVQAATDARDAARLAAANRRRIVPEKGERIVLPQDASVELVFARLPDRMRDLCEFTRETGLRLDEVTSLRHTALDRVERTITVERGKGGKTRVVPLTSTAESIVDRQPRYIGKPWAFWQGKGERLTGVSSRMGGYMRRVAQKAAHDGVEFHPFSHHDFRHLFAVEYLRQGRGSIYDLQGELGHGTITVTERYLAFLTPDQVRAVKSTVAQRGAHIPRSEVASTA